MKATNARVCQQKQKRDTQEQDENNFCESLAHAAVRSAH
jgi:hypothetical protein